MNPRRMEAETVRDSLLAVSGELDTTIGGPELDENMGQTPRRRSFYFTQRVVRDGDKCCRISLAAGDRSMRKPAAGLN